MKVRELIKILDDNYQDDEDVIALWYGREDVVNRKISTRVWNRTCENLDIDEIDKMFLDEIDTQIDLEEETKWLQTEGERSGRE